jgi:hypothetical protein
MKGLTESRQRRMTPASFLTIMLRQTVGDIRRELEGSLAILEEQISIGAGRDDPREIPAGPAPSASMRALVAPASRRPASFADRQRTVRRPRRFFVWQVAAHDDRDLSLQDR